MNRKLLAGAVAGVAAIALAVGGVTYAAWSDSADVTGNQVGAGTLTLDLANNQSGSLKFDHVLMAPGQIGAQRQVYIASNNGQSVPSGVLSVSLKNLQGTEDGCHGGELAVDPSCGTTGTGPTMGQFIDDAQIQWYSYVPSTPGHCTQSNASAATTVRGQFGGSLAHLASVGSYSLMSQDALPITTAPTGRVVVPWLAPGYGICFAMEVSLAYGVDNATQGDSASFDLQFDLAQAPSGTPTTPYTGVGAPTISGWVPIP